MKNFFCSFILIATLATIEGITIQCRFSVTNANYISGLVYYCDAFILNPHNPTVIDYVTGIHEDGKTDANVEVLSLQSRDLKFFPENLADIFPNLRSMNFINSNIASLTAENLRPFPELLTLYIWSNKLVSLDGDLFSHNLKLRRIDFDNNLLQHVGYNLLTYLTWLEVADFSNNPCIDVYARSTEIRSLNALLPVRCPPLPVATTLQPIMTTTETPIKDCQLRCSLNDEIDNLKNENVELRNEVAELRDQIGEIQKQVREINANPRL